MFLLAFIGLILMNFYLTITDSIAVNNCTTENDSGNPAYPENYQIFKKRDGSVDTSYSSHDWIADAVIRELRLYSKSKRNNNVWKWLIDRDLARDTYPSWTSSYKDPTGKHYVKRSYFTYLYATQMPDIRTPGKIPILKEGTTIKNFPSTRKPYSWIGNTDLHHYHFNVVFKQGKYIYPPKTSNPSSGEIVNRIAKDGAIHYMALLKNGQSAMKPETTAAYLGALTHYFADLASPAHLIAKATKDPQFGSKIYYDGYHSWFESQLSVLTIWNKKIQGRSGPYTGYFTYDIEWASITSTISPKSVYARLANENILIATGNGKPYNPNDPKSSIYIDDSTKSWSSWKEDLDQHGRTGSIHRSFYDKVEMMLTNAIEFCASAFEWIYFIVKAKIGNQDLNPDKGDDGLESIGQTEDSIGNQWQNLTQGIANLVALGSVIVAGEVLNKKLR
jgi:hypothetical protein